MGGWVLKKKGKKYCVVNVDTGKAAKCFDNITEAELHRRKMFTSKKTVTAKTTSLKKSVGPKAIGR